MKGNPSQAMLVAACVALLAVAAAAAATAVSRVKQGRRFDESAHAYCLTPDAEDPNWTTTCDP